MAQDLRLELETLESRDTLMMSDCHWLCPFVDLSRPVSICVPPWGIDASWALLMPAAAAIYSHLPRPQRQLGSWPTGTPNDGRLIVGKQKSTESANNGNRQWRNRTSPQMM